MQPNATDRRQIKLADSQNERREARRRLDLRTLLGLSEGRRIFSWMIEELQPLYTQMWNPNAAITGRDATRHDVGQWLKQRIDQVDPDALLLMAQEARLQDKQDEMERQALAAGRRDKPASSVNQSETDDPED